MIRNGTHNMDINEKKSRVTAVVSVLVVMTIVSSAVAFFFWMKWRQTEQSSPVKTAQKEINSTLERVGRLMILPEGAQPTVATIKDPEQLKDQQFFINAKIGDKLLIYSAARKAILYRPSEDKIIEVAPLNIGDSQ